MGRRKQDRVEFRFYEIPHGDSALALLGDAWVGTYGRGEICLHFHNLFEIGYCHYGSGVLILGEKEYHYEDAMVSAIPANYLHTTVSEGVDSWEFLYVDPEEILLEMYPNNPRLRAEKIQIVSRNADLFRIDEYPELASTLWRLIEEMREKRPYYQEAARSLVKLYLLELIRIREKKSAEGGVEFVGSPHAMAQILPALRFMEEHYAQPLRAKELAGCCGLSEPHFRRVFQDEINMAPMDYLNLVRIQKACRLMSVKDYAMDFVASECGFSSVSTFTRNFRKFLDTTPYQWKLQENMYRGHLLGYDASLLRGWESAGVPNVPRIGRKTR